MARLINPMAKSPFPSGVRHASKIVSLVSDQEWFWALQRVEISPRSWMDQT